MPFGLKADFKQRSTYICIGHETLKYMMKVLCPFILFKIILGNCCLFTPVVWNNI